MLKNTSTNKLIRLALILFALITVVVILFAIISQSNTREVEILVAPTSATVTIDGKTYENGTYRLPAGELTVRIEKPNFITQTFTFDTIKNDRLYAYLLQQDGTFSWYETHQEDDVIMSAIGSREAAARAEAYSQKFPITTLLPIIFAEYDEKYNYTEFRIDGGKFEGCHSDFCLKVTDSTGGNFDIAKELLLEKGINPTDYEILYEYTPIVPLN